MDTLSKRICALRKMQGMSQEDLGEQLGVTRQSVSKWESDQATPDLEYLLKMCEIFSVSADYLLRGAESVQPPAESAVQTPVRPPEPKGGTARPFMFGMLLTAVGLIGVIAFVVMAAVEPWGAIVGRWAFDGLMGFIIGTRTWPWFMVCCLLGLTGIGLCCYHSFFNKEPKE